MTTAHDQRILTCLRALRASRLCPTMLVLMLMTVGFVSLQSTAHAAGCPNEQIRTEQTYASSLPDCRAYEQVSPAEKNLTDARGGPGHVQASPSGEGIVYFSLAAFPGLPGAETFPTYLSTRGEAGWSTQGLLPEPEEGTLASVLGLTEDLSETLVATNPGLEPGATPGEVRSYLRDSATGAFSPLARGRVAFADATPDASRVLFEDEDEAGGVTNLYEWEKEGVGSCPRGQASGCVSLAGVLSGGSSPSVGAVAGPSGQFEGVSGGGSNREFYTQNTISQDGSRVFFTDLENGHIYMREPEAEKTIEVSKGAADWRASTPDGSKAFYIEGEELYRFDLAGETREPLTSGAAGVLGTLGISDDGSYVYFAAMDDLTSGGAAVAPVGPKQANIYVWHEGEGVTLVATKLSSEEAGQIGLGNPDWRAYIETSTDSNGSAGGGKTSRITPDGKALLFSSPARLTGYDNAGHEELYLYNAPPKSTLTCVSCNPSGAPASSDVYLTHDFDEGFAAPNARNAFLTRNLSEDGRRVFFETEEALVPQDINGRIDVYEWEQKGEGGCPKGGGCVYLISTGQSADNSFFGDASANGEDVFLFTRQSLVSQDQDYNLDLYDARVDGGIAAQNPATMVPCGGEVCHGVPALAPVFGTPSTAMPSGAGNLTPPATESKSPAKAKANPKSLTHSQQLAKALKACRKKRREKRAGCEAAARKRYGSPSNVKRSAYVDRRRHS